ncbi:MAG: TIGR01777 family protein [Chlorobi bacterium]|nr:TIGR01777 family protein [Chlorobiota bacterium]
METVLITGGTGLVGTYLSNKLLKRGYSVSFLSRAIHETPSIKTFVWNYQKQTIDIEALNNIDYIIHLAGANIGERRWTNSRKQLILDSRLKTGQLIFDKVNEHNIKLKAFISASATGYYGTITTDKIFMETNMPANDFLGNVCNEWEKISDKFGENGIRNVKIRTGVVLSGKGGALSKIIRPVKLGLGSAIGTGRQFMPWIHIDDLCEIYVKAIEDKQMEGAYNAVSPDHKTNEDFTKILASILNKPYWLPKVPPIVMKLAFGEMSDLLLKGSRVSAEKILKTGFEFRFTDLRSALSNLI